MDLFLDILKKVNLFFGENLGLKRLATGQKMFWNLKYSSATDFKLTCARFSDYFIHLMIRNARKESIWIRNL